MDTKQPLAAGKLMIGLILLAVGVAAFLDAIDVWEAGPLWSYWPLLLIAIGAANAVDAIRRRHGDGSWFLLGIGVWMLAGSFNLFGLSYSEAFPLAVIFVGIGAVLHAVIDVPQLNKENGHERQQ
jgi:hypothetical protein